MTTPEPISNETIGARASTAVTKQALSYIAKAIIAAVGGLFIIFGLGIWLYLKPLLVDLAGGVPPGAVMAFDSTVGCPPGWEYFDRGISRVIVGATPPGGNVAHERLEDKNLRSLTARPYRSEGGAENHALRLEEMPPHDHGIEILTRDDYVKGVTVWTNGGLSNVRTDPTTATATLGRDTIKGMLGPDTRFTEAVGGGQPFELMPPYVSLFMCRKR